MPRYVTSRHVTSRQATITTTMALKGDEIATHDNAESCWVIIHVCLDPYSVVRTHGMALVEGNAKT